MALSVAESETARMSLSVKSLGASVRILLDQPTPSPHVCQKQLETKVN